MRRRLFGFVVLCALGSACSGQDVRFSEKWRSVDEPLLGRALIPCEPKLSRELQGSDGIYQSLGVNCEIDGIRFLLSRRNHLEPSEDRNAAQTFDDNRDLLKAIFGNPSEFEESEQFLRSGIPSRIYSLSFESGGRVTSLISVGEHATFEAMIGITPDSEKKNQITPVEFEAIAKKFLGSFEPDAKK